MDYELILFDADGTLFDYDRAERHALEKACRMHRLEYSERLLERYRKINSALWRQLEEGGLSHLRRSEWKDSEVFFASLA